ncbi:MAG: pyridoxamine 5'-phosphate oxidase family protein, partial [Pseudonocardia sp.]|nr:pyridoxamine 5'-phosphate oxidase family protein [Pseudonocardia sp.]
MATWKDVESAAPELAARARAILDAHKHKTIATLRADGSPRISGIEVQFAGGDLTFGSMPGARKGADLRRDPRFALHSASVDPPADQAAWVGDAKVAGRAELVGPLDGPAPGDLFRAEVHEVVVTGLNADATLLVIESWTP